MQRSAIVVCGGGPARRPLPPIDATLVIAADGGIEEAERLELRVDLLVGDMDSAPPSALPDVEATGGRVERYAADKDASDLELALEAAERERVAHVLVVGEMADASTIYWATPCCWGLPAGPCCGSTPCSEMLCST